MKSVIEKIQIDNKNKDKIQMRRGDEREGEKEQVRGGRIDGVIGNRVQERPDSSEEPVAAAATAGLQAQAIASPSSDGEGEREREKVLEVAKLLLVTATIRAGV